MLDIEIIRKRPEEIREALTKRGKDTSTLEQFQKTDERWRKITQEVEELRAEQKEAAAKRNQEKGKELKDRVKELETELAKLESERYALLLEFPNIPFNDVPVGKDESENKAIKTWGEIPKFDFKPKDHLELGEKLGIINVQKAAEVSGSRFYYLKGAGALLEFALIQFATKTLYENGFVPIIPPAMIKKDAYEKMGRLTPSQQEERYYMQADDLYLVGSAEHTIGPLHMNETFDASQLPKRYVGFSTCFRREAGSYGKDVRGILRVHQFDKIEMYSFADPKKSEEEHRFLLSMQEKLYQALEIPYQITEICTGDMGPTDARQYDINAWIPSQQTYREVGSCSNTTDYQTRGIRTKIKNAGKTEYAHALNATGLAIGRTIIAILENNQRADGTVIIPKALHPYMPEKMTEIK